MVMVSILSLSYEIKAPGSEQRKEHWTISILKFACGYKIGNSPVKVSAFCEMKKKKNAITLRKVLELKEIQYLSV